MGLIHPVPIGFHLYTRNNSPKPLVLPSSHCVLVMWPGVATMGLPIIQTKRNLKKNIRQPFSTLEVRNVFHPHFWLIIIVKNSFCLFIPLSMENFIKLSLCLVVGMEINKKKFSLLNQTVV